MTPDPRTAAALALHRFGFGPRTGNSRFAQGLIKPGQPVRSIIYPGRPDVGHAWAYLPDVAAAVA